MNGRLVLWFVLKMSEYIDRLMMDIIYRFTQNKGTCEARCPLEVYLLLVSFPCFVCIHCHTSRDLKRIKLELETLILF